MSDSSLPLWVSLFASIAIAVLFSLWLRERDRRAELQTQLKTTFRTDTFDLAHAIANGTAHPLAAWRLGAGLDVASVASVLEAPIEDLKAAEDGKDHQLDPTAIAVLIASSSASTSPSSKTSGAPIIGSADAPAVL